MQSFHQFLETKNRIGEIEYHSYGAWRKALKAAWPNVEIQGNKDIANALVGGRGVGEWDGDVGTIYQNQHKPIIQYNRQPNSIKEFFAAILATPNDAGLRNVFADWLEDRGNTTDVAVLRQSNNPIFLTGLNAGLMNWDQFVATLKKMGMRTYQWLSNTQVIDRPDHYVPLARFKIIHNLFATLLR